jgi:hypothetical protein
MRHHHTIRSAVAGLAIAAVAAAPAAAQQDLRSPDTRDAAQGRGVYSAPAASPQDLRSPDTRDAALGRGPSTAPDVTVITVPEPAPVTAGGGIDWSDAGLGAAVMLVLAGLVVFLYRRRSGPPRPQAAVAG